MAMDVHGRQWYVMLIAIVTGLMAVFAAQTRHGRDCEACSPDSRAALCVYKHVK
jgi:branched-subunit amino acid ABC-type transport system permease component